MALAILFSMSLPAQATGGAEEAFKSVVVVRCGQAEGSGFALGQDCVITNAHVVDSGDRIALSIYKGGAYPAQVVAIDETADLAALRIIGTTLPALKIADLATVGVGDNAYAVGAPDGMAYSLTKGIVSSLDRQIGSRTFIQTDASINPGNSGGPLLTDSWDVIGVATLKDKDAEGIGLAIPITEVSAFLQRNGIMIDTSGQMAVDTGKSALNTSAPEATAAASRHAPVTPLSTRDMMLILAIAMLCITNLAAVAVIIVLAVRLRKLSKQSHIVNDFEIVIEDEQK